MTLCPAAWRALALLRRPERPVSMLRSCTFFCISSMSMWEMTGLATTLLTSSAMTRLAASGATNCRHTRGEQLQARKCGATLAGKHLGLPCLHTLQAASLLMCPATLPDVGCPVSQQPRNRPRELCCVQSPVCQQSIALHSNVLAAVVDAPLTYGYGRCRRQRRGCAMIEPAYCDSPSW